MEGKLQLSLIVLFLGCKSYAAVTTADQVYFTVLDLKKKQFSSLFRGFEPFVDDEVGESIQVRSSGLYQQFGEKTPGQNWGKIIVFTSKLGEISDKEYNKGSKIYLQNQVILDCFMSSIPLKHKCSSINLIWVSVSPK